MSLLKAGERRSFQARIEMLQSFTPLAQWHPGERFPIGNQQIKEQQGAEACRSSFPMAGDIAVSCNEASRPVCWNSATLPKVPGPWFRAERRNLYIIVAPEWALWRIEPCCIEFLFLFFQLRRGRRIDRSTENIRAFPPQQPAEAWVQFENMGLSSDERFMSNTERKSDTRQIYRYARHKVRLSRLSLSSPRRDAAGTSPAKNAAQLRGMLALALVVLLLPLEPGRLFAQQTSPGNQGWSQYEQYNNGRYAPNQQSEQQADWGTAA